MTCSRCGQVNAVGAAYCVRCGQALAVAPVPHTASTPPVLPAFPTPLPPVAQSSIPFQPPPGAAGASIPVSTGSPDPAPVAPYTRKRRGRGEENALRSLAAVTYACRLCGNPVPAIRRVCATCDAPHGMIANPGDPTGGTYLPIGSLYPAPVDAIEAMPARPLLAAIADLRWNWGAFGASTPWLFAHRLPGWGLITLGFTLLAPLTYYGALYLLLPACGVLISLLVGLQGHALAWQRGRHDSLETHLRVETRWKWLGLVGTLVKGIVLIALALNTLNHK
jgi:hypothetical protein